MPSPSHATRRAEELGPVQKADGILCLFQIGKKFRVGMSERRPIDEVVVRNFVSGSLDPGDEFRVAQSAIANEKKCGLGIVAAENLENLGCVDRVRAIIEGKGNERKIGSHAILEVRSESFEHTEDHQRLNKEDEKPERDDNAA